MPTYKHTKPTHKPKLANVCVLFANVQSDGQKKRACKEAAEINCFKIYLGIGLLKTGYFKFRRKYRKFKLREMKS